MILFPNCKINLGLNILRKRADGYHDIETVFYPVPFHDVLEIIPASDGRFAFSTSGLMIPGDMEKNLCVSAYRLLRSDFPIPEVKMHLHKVIPMGAGLGGGSSDGAFTLLLMNRLFNLELDEGTLMDYARKLGSDCPFFIRNQPAFASGRGDLFEPSPVSLAGWNLALVFPGIHAGTSEAYAMITPKLPSRSLKKLMTVPVSGWKGWVTNDFETVMIREYPVIGQIRDQLYNQGAAFAAMTGSGSAVFGLFRESPVIANLPPGCFTSSCIL